MQSLPHVLRKTFPDFFSAVFSFNLLHLFVSIEKYSKNLFHCLLVGVILTIWIMRDE